MRRASEMERIRRNIKKIMDGFYYLTNINPTAEFFNWQKANNWEQILYETEMLIFGMKNYFVYSGVSNAGQRRLWQNRFRRFKETELLVTQNGDYIVTEDDLILEVE